MLTAQRAAALCAVIAIHTNVTYAGLRERLTSCYFLLIIK